MTLTSPNASFINRIQFDNLRGDVFGGVAAAIVSLPMALAFGVASGAGPAAGLYGAIVIGFFASLFGGTPTLISEPTGPMTVVMTAVISSLIAADSENGMAMAFTVVMLAGVFQIIFGLLKLGKYVTLMPYSVISGFMSGIGFLLIILQLAPLFGFQNVSGGALGAIQTWPQIASDFDFPEFALGVITLAILFFTPRRLRQLCPPQLTALVFATIISLIAFQEADINRIGSFNVGIPQLTVPTFTLAQLRIIFVDALVLGMLGCIDSLLTSVVADSLTKTQHNSNKEIVGQGIGNIVSGAIGGLPGAGATMGTVVNIQTGGRTILSGLVRSGVLLVVVVLASGITASIPQAVLAGIAIRVGIGCVDWGFLKRSLFVSRKAAAITYSTIAITVFGDLITAVAIGVFVANVLTIERLTQLRVKSFNAITDADDEIQLSQEESLLLKRGDNRILLFHLDGPMIFGVAKAIEREQAALDDKDVLVVDLSDVPMMGVTSSLAIENTIEQALDKGLEVFIVGASGSVQRRLEKFGIFDVIPSENQMVRRVEALRRAVDVVNHKIGKPQAVTL
ncbi:MAG: SulP family inorganic anion transporter [Cyanobacteria bacterium P01_E01_bin.34]